MRARAPPGAWFAHVNRQWNRFKAVREGTNQSMLITMEMVAGSGPDANPVQVVPPPTTGRANAGTWYVADAQASETVPHEFGHLIGLRDEYQLHPGDFRTITGREPDVGSTAGPLGVTPLQIAQNLRAAMMARSSPNAFAAVAGVQPGAFAQQIVQQYATLGAATVPAVVAAPGVAAMLPVPLTTNLVRDLDAALVDNAALDRYNTIQVLTYSSGSLMGDSSRARDPHDHGAQPRHVQEFVDTIAAGARAADGTRSCADDPLPRHRRARRTGHDELLEIDGRAFRLWRSSGAPVAGQFAGTLSARRRSRSIRRSRASPASTRRPPWRPGISRPRQSRRPTDAGSTSATSRRVTGPWGALAASTARPRWTVSRTVRSRPRSRSRWPTTGRAPASSTVAVDPIEVDVSALRIAVQAWQGYYEPAGTLGARAAGPDRAAGRPVRAGAWTSRSRTASRLATATPSGRGRLRAADDDEWRPVGVVRVPVIDPPEASRSVD